MDSTSTAFCPDLPFTGGIFTTTLPDTFPPSGGVGADAAAAAAISGETSASDDSNFGSGAVRVNSSALPVWANSDISFSRSTVNARAISRRTRRNSEGLFNCCTAFCTRRLKCSRRRPVNS